MSVQIALNACAVEAADSLLRQRLRSEGYMISERPNWTPWVGRVVSGRYRVISKLGSGGMGAVYLAEDLRAHGKVALKVMHRHLTAMDEFVTRFHREAAAALLIANEHVVDVLDIGRRQDGSYYLAMEYVQGTDVSEVGVLSVARAAAIGLQVCEALEAVHAAGIVHRDVKPEHVALVSRSGIRDFVKLLDFGMCKLEGSLALTGAGIALGTPRYMAPEQLEAQSDVDSRADLYAFGAVLFYMLVGRAPFDAKTLPELLLRVWRDPPPRLGDLRSDVPKALAVLVRRALDKQPSRRPTLCEFRLTLSAATSCGASPNMSQVSDA